MDRVKVELFRKRWEDVERVDLGSKQRSYIEKMYELVDVLQIARSLEIKDRVIEGLEGVRERWVFLKARNGKK